MGKGLGWILPAAVAATVMTGGAAAPAIAGSSGAGAAGAGAATGAGLLGAGGSGLLGTGGVGVAGDALAAQGAAGLIGSAGATAAGFGAPIAGAELGSIAGAGASELPAGMAAYGHNGEYTGATIANDGMAANSFTGGYDALNPFQRGMQRLGSVNFNSNGMKMAKTGMDLMGNPQHQQVSQNVNSNAQVAPRQQQMPQGSYLSSSNNGMTEEELKHRSWLQNLGHG